MVLHVKCKFHSNRDTLTYFTAKNRSKSFICINGLKSYRGLRFGTHTFIVSVLIPTDFLHCWAIFGPLADKNTWTGCYWSSQPAKKFSGHLWYMFEISVWNLTHTSRWWCHTSSSSFIPTWTLWPTVQSKISQSNLSAYMALKIYRGLRFGTHTQIVSVLTPTDFCHAWAIVGPLVDKNTRKGGGGGGLVELPASDPWGLSFIRIRSLPLKSFPYFFLNVLLYQLESWFIHWVGCTTYWVHVSLEWDPCDLHVISLGTVN